MTRRRPGGTLALFHRQTTGGLSLPRPRRVAVAIVAVTGGDGLQAQDFTLFDQSGVPWSLSEHLDTARIVVFLRGDW